METGIIRIGKKQAIRFLLLKQGLLGPYRFHGKDGIVSYLQQAGCIQFDPIDVCGKNPELVLQARVQGLKKGMLYKVLYQDRAAVDYFDKQLSILPVGDWKYFARTRQWFQEYFAGREDITSAFDIVRREFLHRAFLSSRDLALEQKVDWPWAPTKLSRAALEGLYFCGELVIHHKEGTLKYYAPAKHMLSPELLRQEDPFASDQEFFNWRVFRRIGAVGLLWNRPSDAFLGIDGLKAAQRERAFEVLTLDGRIVPIQVESGSKKRFTCKNRIFPCWKTPVLTNPFGIERN